jgi:hypothetical protein
MPAASLIIGVDLAPIVSRLVCGLGKTNANDVYRNQFRVASPCTLLRRDLERTDRLIYRSQSDITTDKCAYTVEVAGLPNIALRRQSTARYEY